MNKAIWVIACLIFCSQVHAQSGFKEYMKVLTSDSLAGRGYVDQGQEKAADYIIRKLKGFGLQAGNAGDFKQTLSYPVNQLSDSILFSLSLQKGNDIQLREGRDFLINAASPDIYIKNAEPKIIKDLDAHLNYESRKVYLVNAQVYDRKLLNNFIQQVTASDAFNNSVFILNNYGKLSWAPSYSQASNAIVYLKDGFEEINTVTAYWTADLKENFSSSNVIAKIDNPNTEKAIVFTAHYDHLGRLGEAIFRGAHDNASGVSMLLSLANSLSTKSTDYDIYFIFFTAEEIGLLGSRYFVQNPVFPLINIKLLINLDLLGTGDEGITVVNGIEQAEFVEYLKKSVKKIPTIKVRDMACNSDHCFFDQLGVPSVFIYTLGGKKAYHDIYDDGSGLSFFAYPELKNILVQYCR